MGNGAIVCNDLAGKGCHLLLSGDYQEVENKLATYKELLSRYDVRLVDISELDIKIERCSQQEVETALNIKFN